MNKKQGIILAVLVAAIGAFFVLDLGQYLNLAALKGAQEQLQAQAQAQPLLASLGFFAIYVAVTALSLPGAALMTLAAGAIFGLGWGLLIVSFASSVGATLAFLVSRHLLRDSIQNRYGKSLKSINQGVERDGAFYLFALRLVPAFPFFLINLVMGLTPLKTWTFYWVSQLGMLAGTAVYVNAGTQLAQIQSLGDVASPGLLGAFALLGIFPIIAKKLIDGLRARKVYRGFSKPKSFDTNLIVIGAGSAGLVSAYIAAAVKAKVTLIEKHRMGGDCLNTGCVPSKAILRSAKLLDHARRSREFGIAELTPKFAFGDVMKRVHEVIAAIEPHDSVERYTELGVDCVQGEARLVDPWTVEVNGQRITAPSIIIATGARPFVPPIPGLEDTGYLTSDTVWELTECPKRLVVLGGGPIGSELTQAFARLGAQVTQVEMMDRLVGKEDPEVSELLAKRLREEGVDVRLKTRATAVEVVGGEKQLVCEGPDGSEQRIPFDEILVAVGRAARLDGFGLKELGIAHGRTVQVNEYLQTSFPNIYACGDVAGPYQFTHTASHMAWYCAVNALFGRFKKFKVDYSVVPWATFTEPEIATVGLNELAAKEQGVDYEVTTYGIDDLDRAIADGEAHGFVKVLTVPGKDKILGVTIVGEHAGDLIAEYVLAMKHGLGLNKILGTIHIYPTLAEANKFVAGNWKRANKPDGLLAWVEKLHAWGRG